MYGAQLWCIILTFEDFVWCIRGFKVSFSCLCTGWRKDYFRQSFRVLICRLYASDMVNWFFYNPWKFLLVILLQTSFGGIKCGFVVEISLSKLDLISFAVLYAYNFLPSISYVVCITWRCPSWLKHVKCIKSLKTIKSFCSNWWITSLYCLR